MKCVSTAEIGEVLDMFDPVELESMNFRKTGPNSWMVRTVVKPGVEAQTAPGTAEENNVTEREAARGAKEETVESGVEERGDEGAGVGAKAEAKEHSPGFLGIPTSHSHDRKVTNPVAIWVYRYLNPAGVDEGLALCKALWPPIFWLGFGWSLILYTDAPEFLTSWDAMPLGMASVLLACLDLFLLKTPKQFVRKAADKTTSGSGALEQWLEAALETIQTAGDLLRAHPAPAAMLPSTRSPPDPAAGQAASPLAQNRAAEASVVHDQADGGQALSHIGPSHTAGGQALSPRRHDHTDGGHSLSPTAHGHADGGQVTSPWGHQNGDGEEAFDPRGHDHTEGGQVVSPRGHDHAAGGHTFNPGAQASFPRAHDHAEGGQVFFPHAHDHGDGGQAFTPFADDIAGPSRLLDDIQPIQSTANAAPVPPSQGPHRRTQIGPEDDIIQEALETVLQHHDVLLGAHARTIHAIEATAVRVVAALGDGPVGSFSGGAVRGGKTQRSHS